MGMMAIILLFDHNVMCTKGAADIAIPMSKPCMDSATFDSIAFWIFYIQKYLCKFSASSIVSGNIFPLVSGKSNTKPASMRPITASNTQHK